MIKTAVLGGGSWGTALARELALNKHDTTMYIRDESQLNELIETKTNKKYLPEVVLPDNLKYTSDIKEAIKAVEFLILAVPTNSVRKVLENIKGLLNEDVIIINVAKGIEMDTLKRISEIVKEFFPKNKFVALSGPTHAEEVAIDYPTTIVAASEDLDAANMVQNLFMSSTLRVYTNDDLIGVELAGALKNIIALANGVLVGLGYGDNSKAALMTRGLAETTRLAIEMGARPSTFLGLAGVGDIIVTCTSEHSRNRRCGKLIGEGKSVDEAVKEVGMVVEGIKTTKAAKELSKKYAVDMPIADALYEVIYNDKDPGEMADKLMLRKKRHESDEYFRSWGIWQGKEEEIIRKKD